MYIFVLFFSPEELKCFVFKLPYSSNILWLQKKIPSVATEQILTMGELNWTRHVLVNLADYCMPTHYLHPVANPSPTNVYKKKMKKIV